MANAAQNVQMKMASENAMNQMMDEKPMKISDAYSMFHKAISANEGALDAIVIGNNNALVERWRDQVLIPLGGSRASLPAGKVASSLNIFLEGVENRKYMANRHLLPVFPEELVRKWVAILRTSSVGDLIDLGSSMTKIGWDIIVGYIRDHQAQQKSAEIFSLSDDPLDWDNLANDKPLVMYSKNLPLDLTPEILEEIVIKIRPFSRNVIQA